MRAIRRLTLGSAGLQVWNQVWGQVQATQGAKRGRVTDRGTFACQRVRIHAIWEPGPWGWLSAWLSKERAHRYEPSEPHSSTAVRMQVLTTAYRSPQV